MCRTTLDHEGAWVPLRLSSPLPSEPLSHPHRALATMGLRPFNFPAIRSPLQHPRDNVVAAALSRVRRRRLSTDDRSGELAAREIQSASTPLRYRQPHRQVLIYTLISSRPLEGVTVDFGHESSEVEVPGRA
eukprot:396936-Hanusia_phi.AAC.1